MKVFFTTILLLIFFVDAKAQSLNGKPITQVESEYIRIISNEDESDIYVDFGTKYNAPRFNIRLADPTYRNILKNKDGHEVIFASVIDALNFMSNSGYYLVETHTITEKNVSMFHYIMRKKAD